MNAPDHYRNFPPNITNDDLAPFGWSMSSWESGTARACWLTREDTAYTIRAYEGHLDSEVADVIKHLELIIASLDGRSTFLSPEQHLEY